mmetsp:Transcript_63969/g.101821  ORF Transcript_63969/g.101821 Transcript_63969/m.101821 type:complete len:217 (+) Transcript_63969:121-771(+)
MAAAPRAIKKCTDLTDEQAFDVWKAMTRSSKRMLGKEAGIYDEGDIRKFLSQDGGNCEKKVEREKKKQFKESMAKKKKGESKQSAASRLFDKMFGGKSTTDISKLPDLERLPSDSMAHQSIYDEYRDYDLVDAQGQALYVPGYTNGYSYYAPPALGSSSGAGSTDFAMIMAIGLAAFVLVCLVCLMISVVIGAGCFLYNQRAKQVVKYQALRDEQV